MNRTNMLLATVAFFGSVTLVAMMPTLAAARPADVDWKLYGGFDRGSPNEKSYCFYDSSGVTHFADNRLRVWVKCLRQRDLDAVDIKESFGGKILENTAKKVADYYVPPISTVQSLDAEQAMTITQYEETADVAAIQPQASIFYEISCTERKIRELSMTINMRGRRGSDDKSSEWKFVPPEGNAANLLKILCGVP
ncbi:hypothetical protein [Burkholderia sp. Ac-20365]|uniref:hypothetical protein n=1 Tax=Burkholderia sp. Ac-20365 TaxID=2703897 RepID=UPI00197B12AE|nr:hypothetical protein [Burkholderia sp. Ac-20365]MBN3761139.1 hypothetical protein [Burkholderia sp. Ac-20365]